MPITDHFKIQNLSTQLLFTLVFHFLFIRLNDLAPKVNEALSYISNPLFLFLEPPGRADANRKVN